MTPSEHRSFLIHYARVHLREARARRHQRAFAAHLLGSAGRARRDAAKINTSPAQGDLFAAQWGTHAMREATA
jgi:hypothetical protein